jgi:hypothetical protein
MKFDASAKDLGNRMTIDVKIADYGQWKIRIWIGTKLVQLAAWIMWVNVKFVEDEV